MSTTASKQAESAEGGNTGELDERAQEQVNGGIIAILIGLAKSNPTRYTGPSSGSPLPTEMVSLN